MDFDDLPKASIIGDAEVAEASEQHNPHSYLYLPDVSSQTGWAAHLVPERVEKAERGHRPMGFRR